MTTQGDSRDKVFVSIQLNSNRPGHLDGFLSSVEDTASRPSQIEVLIHIDEGDEPMERAVVEEAARRTLRIRYLKTDIVKSFFDLWKPLNLLLPMTAPSAYFVFNGSDEFRFLTQGWDDVLRKYVGYYDDGIFRIRASRLRYRNYRDVWECGFAPDSLAFYTKRWLDIVGDWNPCLGPDSFQQCIAFYLFTEDQFNINQENRDIPEPFLRFSGEGGSIGLEEEALRTRVYGHVREWFILMSPTMQQEAKRRAMLLRAHIWTHRRGLGHLAIEDDAQALEIVVRTPILQRERRWSYRIGRLSLMARNNYRKLRYHVYAGGGSEAAYSTLLEGTAFYLSYKFPRLGNLVGRVRAFRSPIRSPIRFLFAIGLNDILSAVGFRDLVVGRHLRRLMEIVVPLLKTPGVQYYVYGTGEYARRICSFVQSRALVAPLALIEWDDILAQKGYPTERHGILVRRDQDVIGGLTPDQFVIVGSLVYAGEVSRRLREARCQATVVDLSGW